MKHSFLKLSCLALSFLAAGHCYGQYTVSDRTKKVIDSTYAALIKKNHVVGASIAIVDGGKLVYAAGYGFADDAKKIKADEKTVYRIGSCTKSFTALSILQLQEKGLLNVNNSVKDYLPELTITSRFKDDNNIFIKDMLCHVSGLPCDISNGFFCNEPPDINWVIAELNKQTTMSPRHYKHAYSNVAYGLLGEVIARTSKSSYSDYVKNNIFIPLGMSSSFITYDEKLAANFSKGYVNKKEMKEGLIRDQAAGLIHSTAPDMANYINMYLGRGTFNGRQLLSPAGIAEMEKNQLGNTLLSSQDNWGYGLYSRTVQVKQEKDSTVATLIGHGGDTYAYHADFGYIPELNVGVVILTNTDRGTALNNAAQLLKIYLKETKGKTLNTRYSPKDTAALAKTGEQPCTAGDVIGHYNFGAFVMDAKQVTKMHFQQGPAKIVLRQKKSEPLHYTARAVLFKIVPVKIKNQELAFVKLNGEVYLKAINTKNKKFDYLAVKTGSVFPATAWQNKLGEYKVVSRVYACTNCPYNNMEGIHLKLSLKGGLLCMNTKGKSADTKNTAYLDVISDTLAVTGGIGRGTGETVCVLANGNIYYSGFEFARAK